MRKVERRWLFLSPNLFFMSFFIHKKIICAIDRLLLRRQKDGLWTGKTREKRKKKRSTLLCALACKGKYVSSSLFCLSIALLSQCQKEMKHVDVAKYPFADNGVFA